MIRLLTWALEKLTGGTVLVLNPMDSAVVFIGDKTGNIAGREMYLPDMAPDDIVPATVMMALDSIGIIDANGNLIEEAKIFEAC